MEFAAHMQCRVGLQRPAANRSLSWCLTELLLQVGGKYANTAYLQGSQLFTSGKKRGLEAWVAAHPHIQKALACSQVSQQTHLSDFACPTATGLTAAALGPSTILSQ